MGPPRPQVIMSKYEGPEGEDPIPTKAKSVSKPTVKAKPKESDASKARRMAAYEDWVKTNRDPATKSYLATDKMKNGGVAKTKCMASGGLTSRGDGVAQRGKTKCKYV